MKKTGYRLLAVIMALVMLTGVMAPAMTASAAVGVYLPDGMTFSVTSQDNVFTITRSSGEGTLRVVYRTCSITAVATIHFEHAEGSLDFEDGETEKTVTVTEYEPEDIPVLFRYQGGTFREYRFEVMDHLYSLLAYTVRRIGYGSTYRFTNANVLTEVPELVWYYRRNQVQSSLSSGQYRDVTAQGTENPIQVKDEGYGQNYWSIPTAAATSRSGMGCGEYLSAIGDDLYATVFFPMWEVNDGYQYIQILADEATDFDGTDPDHDVNQPQKSVYKACWELCKGNYLIKDDGDYIMVFPHLTDAVNEDAEKIDRGYPADYEDDTPSVFPYPDTYLYKQMFRSADLRAAASNALVLDPATENLIVRFNARGSGEDTWVFRDLKGRFAVADTRAPAANEILVSRSPVGFRTHDLISVTVTFSEIVHAENAVLRTTWGDLKAESTNGSDANVLTFTGRISASAGTALRILGYTGTIRDMKGYDCAQFSKSMNTSIYQLKEPTTIHYAGGAMRITNAYDMLYYADMLETRPNLSAQLECDVCMVCSELVPFQSMAGTQNGFAGTFDGQDHTIRQLRVLTPSGGYTALFAKTETGAVIRNLKIEAEFTPEVGSFAPIVGYNRGTVEKCAAYFEFPDVFESTGHTATDATCVGGVVALNAGTIRLCSADGLLRMRWPKGSFGGIAGKNTGTMESSYFTGTLREYPGASSVVGGVCGVNSGTVRNCCDAITDSYSHVAIRSNTGTTENVQHLIDTAAASGEVCWVLNGGVTDGSQGWYQNIDNGQTLDPRPGFVNNRENTVYHTRNTYTNTPVLHDGENDVLLRRSTEYQTFLFCPAQNGWYSFYSVGANVDAEVYSVNIVEFESNLIRVSSDADSAGGDFLCSAYLSTVIDYYVRLRLYSGADAAVTIVAEPSQTLYTVTADADAPYLTDIHMNVVEADLPESETTMQAPAGAQIRMAADFIAAVDPETCGFQVTDALGSEIPVFNGCIDPDDSTVCGDFRMPASDVTVTPAAQLYPALHLGENELHCDSEQTFSFTPSRDDGTYTFRNSTDDFVLTVYDASGNGECLLLLQSEGISYNVTLESGKSYPVVITPQVDTDFTVTIEYVPNQHEMFTVVPNVTTAHPGDTITYSVYMDPVTDLDGLQLTLGLPDGLTFGQADTNTNLLKAMAATCPEFSINFSESTLTLLIYTLSTSEHFTSTENGVLLTFTCTVDDDASGEKTIDLPKHIITNRTIGGTVPTEYDPAGSAVTIMPAPPVKAIELVTGGAAANIAGAQKSSVWFGNYKQSKTGSNYNVDPIKWRVLSNADGKMLLLSDRNLDAVQYNGNHENVTWDTCEIRDWLNGYGSMQDVGFLGTAFTAKEQAAIAASTVVSEENPQYSVYGGEDTTDKVFLLSAGEAVTAAYGFTDNYSNTDSRVAINTDYVENRVTFHFNDGAGRWWLRSTGESNDKAAFVSQSGQMNLKGIEVPTSSVAVRPAVNVDLGQVLFVSPAVGGKPAPDAEMDDIFVKNAYGKNIMSPVSDYNGFDWKLTVLDSSRSNFTARCLAFKTGTKNATCKIRYSNATGGEYDRISAMIVDADGHVKYSGVLGYANPATTTFETDVTGQYTPGDRIYIYNEEVHGDKQTDYSSRLIDITPEKLPEGLTATVGQRLADVAIPNPEGNTSGTWTWDDPTIEINTAGEYSFPATFTPSNTDAFETIQTNLTVTINKQDLTATPPTGLAATVGQTLADVAIPNPEGNTPGTWTWDTPTIYLNTAGEYSFAATFTPSNTTAFETINTNLTVTVTAEPNYVFPSGLTAYYGQTLNDVRRWLPSGWAWDDDPSTSVGEPGEHTFPATYTPSDTANYSTVSAMLTVTVEKGWSYSPPIEDLTATVGDTLADVPLPDGWAWDDPSTSLGLVGTYGFPVTFTPEDTTHYRITHAVAIVIVKHVTVEFGSYPQTEVKDEDLIAALNAQTLDWQSYGYYCKSDDRIVARDFMEYCDVTLDGAKYRGVRFSLYRPEKTEYGASPESSLEYHQENNGYYTNTIYWFRYEPLQWCVLDLSTGLAMCETVIDSQPYNNFMLRADDAYYYGDAGHSYYANNYAHSSLRQWLNDDFYNTAFTNAQKSKIAATTIDNRAFDTSHSVYDSASTTDKVFLLSYSDMRNTAYGFESDPGFSSTRGAQVSDYAKCQGLLVQTGYDWWLRSAGEYSGLACTVLGGDSYGAVVADCDVDYTAAGVRPAITLDLQSSTDTPNDTINVTITDGIGVNFYLDFAAPSREGVDSVTVTYKNFSGETVNETYTKDDLALQDDGRYKLTVWIAPAQLADVITVEIGDTVYTQSVLAYCEELKGNQDYSAYFPFVNALEQYAQTANVTFGYSADTITDIADLDKDAVTAYTGAVFTDGTNKVTGASFMALTKPEFRFYMAGVDEQTAYNYNQAGVSATMESSKPDILNARFVKKANGDVLIEVTGVSAENMDKTVTVTVTGLGDITFNGNAFAKAMAKSTDPAQADLGAALFNYGAAAKACFGAGTQEPEVQTIVDLGTLTGDYEAQNGDVLTGTLAGKYKITVADGANITLKDADVTCLDSGAYFAAITPLGDANVTLEGSNIVMGGNGVPGIYVPEDKTLTIDGAGSLEASSTSDACGIGGANQISAGNIVINGGTVTAYGGMSAAGIGCGPGADCGDIIINGGTVEAVGGHQSAGIGSAVGGNCGDITINGGTVTAYGGRESVGIGSGEYGSCGDITISGGTVTAVADENAIRPGIGSGDMYSRCGNVLIKNTVTAVYAVSSGGPGRVDPIGTRYGTCGTVTIEDGANVVMY